MYFRACLSSAVWALSCVFFLMGCSRGLWNQPLREEPPPREFKGIQIGFEKKCLADLLPTMEKFMEGTATADKVSEQWTCFGKALNTFLENVKGARNEEVFTAREIAGFFEFFFLQDLKISDELLREVMHIKQLAVGGDVDVLTREEIRELIRFSGQMNRISLKLLPYMGIYALKWKLSGVRRLEADTEHFENANQTLQEVARELSDRIGSHQSSYRLSSFVVLLKELEKLYGQSWSIVSQLEKGLPLIQKLKSALTGGDEDQIDSKEWRRFAILTARGYLQYLRYHYFVQNSDPSLRSSILVFVTRSIDDLFSFLGDMVREKKEQKFTVQELNEVLGKLEDVFPEFHLPPPLVEQAMKVKQLFFGGGLDSWTAHDFDRARAKVNKLRQINQQILEHADYYSMNWDRVGLKRSELLAERDVANKGLAQFAVDLGDFFETGYDIADLMILLSEIEKSFQQRLDTDILKTIKKYVVLMVAYKNIIFSDTVSRIEKNSKVNQWPVFLKRIFELYSLRLEYEYFLSAYDILRGDALNDFETWSSQAILIARDVLGAKPNQVLTKKELQRLLSALSVVSILPTNFPVGEVQALIQKMIPQLIPPEKRLLKLINTELSLLNLDFLEAEFRGWMEAQKFWSKQYAKVPAGSGVWSADLLRSLASVKGMNEHRVLLQQPRAFQLENRGRTYFGRQEIPITYQAISRLNLMRGLVRLAIRSYAMDLKRLDVLKPGNGLLLSEVNTLFWHLQPLLVSLGVLDKNSTTFPESRFLEANIFMPSSDGNDTASFVEATEIASLITSALSVDSELKLEIEKKCFVIKAKQKLLNSVDANCLMGVYRKELRTSLSSVPLFADFAGRLSSEDFQRLMLALLLAAGSPNPFTEPVIYRDLALVPHVIQYIESVQARYDTDGNGILSKEESMRAYPVFRNLILGFPEVTSEDRAKAGFAYILRYGRYPVTLREKLGFLWWEFFPSRWKFDLDRIKLASIFAFIRKCGKNNACSENDVQGFSLAELNLEQEYPESKGQLTPAQAGFLPDPGSSSMPMAEYYGF